MNEDDEQPADFADVFTALSPPKKKRGGKGKGKSTAAGGGSAEGKGKGGRRGPSTGKGARPGKLPCLCCDEPRVANSRFCKDHKRSCDAMSYQAETSSDPEAKQIFQDIFADDAKCAGAVKKFSLDNPPTAKYKRKQLIDWVQYKRTFGVRVTRRDRSSDVPKTEREFKLWAVNQKGLTDQEAKDWWKKLLDDPNVDRDYEGYGGALQLYVPNAEQSRDRMRDRYVDNAQEEGSAVDKKAKPQDIEAWKFGKGIFW